MERQDNILLFSDSDQGVVAVPETAPLKRAPLYKQLVEVQLNVAMDHLDDLDQCRPHGDPELYAKLRGIAEEEVVLLATLEEELDEAIPHIIHRFGRGH